MDAATNLLMFSGALLGSARVGPRPAVTLGLNARAGFAGDSKSIGVGGTLPSYVARVLWETQGRFYLPPGFMQAVSSQTIDVGGNSFVNQVPSIIAQKFDVLHIDIGTNQLGNVGDGAYGYNVVKNKIIQIILSGVTWVIWKPVGPKGSPNDAGSTYDNERLIYNALVANVQSDPDMALVKNNVFPAANYDAGFNAATMTIDGTHYNWLGIGAVAPSSAAAMNSIITSSTLLSLYTDSSNLLLAANNPQLAGIGGSKSNVSGFVATSWTTAAIINSGLSAPVADCGDHPTTNGGPLLNGAKAQQTTASGTNTQGSGAVYVRTLVVAAGTAPALVVGQYYDGWAAFDASDCTGLETMSLKMINSASFGVGNIGVSAPLMPSSYPLSGVFRLPATQATTTTAAVIVESIFGAAACSHVMKTAQIYMRQIPAGQV